MNAQPTCSFNSTNPKMLCCSVRRRLDSSGISVVDLCLVEFIEQLECASALPGLTIAVQKRCQTTGVFRDC